MSDEQWNRLNISKGKSSYSQERIWLDETIRSMILEQDKDVCQYNSVLAYQITDGYLSIKRFQQSLKQVINKHQIFRTSLEYDFTEQCLMQIINPFNARNSGFEITHFNGKNFDQLILKDQTTKYFDLNEGKIFRCHLLQQNSQEKNRLMKDDYILFIFHHSAIDEYSKFLFFKDLTLAYENDQLKSDENQLRFLDYSFYERQFDFHRSETFWEDYFSNYYFKQKINLPYDDKKFNSISSGSFYFFEISDSLIRQIFRYKKKHQINFFRLFLSTFYSYLFKLTQDTDITITGVTPNRYKKQLDQIIGPMENFVIYRLIIDPKKSFYQLNTDVEQLCLNVKDNSNYPYQKLISYARKCSSSQYPFSQIGLRVFIDDDQLVLDIDQNLILKKINLFDHQIFQRENKLTPIELTLNVICNLEKENIQFYFDYSNKLFTEEKIQLLAKRYQKILKHLFDVSSTFDLEDEPIYKLSIILPEEETLIQSINPPTNRL